MRLFAAVVTDGSFTAAADRLGTDKARVSRIVRRMEEKLGAQLLKRSTRHLSVTEVGRDYFERAMCILTAAEAAQASVAQQSREPKGLIKITAGAEFGTMVVDEWIAAFLRQSPKVTVESEYTSRQVDIIHEGFDIAIRVGTLDDSGLSARKLGDMVFGLYAAPGYLKSAWPLELEPGQWRRHREDFRVSALCGQQYDLCEKPGACRTWDRAVAAFHGYAVSGRWLVAEGTS